MSVPPPPPPPPPPPLAQLHAERLARLGARAPTARFCFVAGSERVDVTLAHLPGIAIGSVVWRGAEVLCAFLVAHPALVAGRRVLELGAGVGLVALVTARLGAAHVLATDGNEDVLRLLRANAAAATPTGVVETASLPWGAAAWPRTDAQALAAATDSDPAGLVVLAADVVYEPVSALLLAETLECVLRGGGPPRQCLLAYKERGAGGRFFAALAARGMTCAEMLTDGENAVFRVSAAVPAGSPGLSVPRD